MSWFPPYQPGLVAGSTVTPGQVQSSDSKLTDDGVNLQLISLEFWRRCRGFSCSRRPKHEESNKDDPGTHQGRVGVGTRVRVAAGIKSARTHKP